MGEWHKYQPPDSNHPCTNCTVSYGSVSSEMRNDELWTKFDDCRETCQMLRDYKAYSLASVLKAGMIKDEPYFGVHIREAIKTIKGE